MSSVDIYSANPCRPCTIHPGRVIRAQSINAVSSVHNPSKAVSSVHNPSKAVSSVHNPSKAVSSVHNPSKAVSS